MYFAKMETKGTNKIVQMYCRIDFVIFENVHTYPTESNPARKITEKNLEQK